MGQIFVETTMPAHVSPISKRSKSREELKVKRTIYLDEFLDWEVGALVGPYGGNRSEVVRFILSRWINSHSVEISGTTENYKKFQQQCSLAVKKLKISE
ncbi:MAG: hypothetical protein UW43_C0001G0079 [Candidatus Yanofskybacteria bacterium GW2011_GWA1_44_21]|uniref:Uncharacterized protein n=2 Tax=Candidatus Yanofskyibacteriota TaxID=1752733 RepID=A0A1F8H316_9BACT|nr:MAG: hypothetical protein UW14_C0002G0029 [Candidatus Yanofskybacteria bacterium GW2011_GWA2_44_10]KKT50914.1 MAG: hypothetical protein UW43_C0001G0079 [Candidatus Yanofskybacteria bacterium GW2011_GWA1_44_21]KKT90486.1 MAG: hypothetical protein UW90_C0001G0074 [Candidatus Yanofskybacteria bacterium GW2011_GWB1_45_11]OGN02341.1 MAG: hypothetical protein A2657_01985 [Candidatus Yanofskybacteria bacterium RIFCSPHIGHO2_01_FULL_44_110b]OGN14293.1 MAG: hypothetical protein A3C01_01740 [Candidatus